MAADLLGPTDIRELCTRLGIRPSKSLGQNFVHDAGTVRRIVRAAAVQPGEHILEIGPGLGSLTLALLEAGAIVTAVEISEVLAKALPDTVISKMPEAAARLRVLTEDALNISSEMILEDAKPSVPGAFPTVGPPTKLVANLPYNVAVPVLLTLLETLPSLREVLVMVQSEVADRLAASPGSRTYGVPSLKVAWYGVAQRAGTIGPSVFWPVPKVSSGLVRIIRHEPTADALTSPADSEQFRRQVFAAVDAAFAQRRKTLRAALAQWAGTAPQAEALLRAAGIDPQLRGERLEISDFISLVKTRHINTVKPRTVTASAPGKVNLYLECGFPDPSEGGYHPLLTVFQAVNLREQITITRRDDSQLCLQQKLIDSQGHPLELPEELVNLSPDQNLAVRAVAEVRKICGSSLGADISLTKRVPVSGGMGGGSADAAAALVAANELWQAGLTTEELLALARNLGADVPFCLLGGTMVGTERGDKMSPLPPRSEPHPPERNWIFATSASGLSTPEVFKEFDQHLGNQSPELATQLPESLERALYGPPEELGNCLRNDLQPAALRLRPELAEVLAAALAAGACGAIVSGSGPTVAALVTPLTTHTVSQALENLPQVSRVISVTGPATGARIEEQS